MGKTLDMRFIRYMNLFGKITKIRAKHCFTYNNMIIFVVPRSKVLRAIGRNNSNLEKISRILSKRIRIVAEPQDKTSDNIKLFIKTIVSPVRFNEILLQNGEATISAGREGKARLIGRGRIRQKELQDILEQYFGIRILKIA